MANAVTLADLRARALDYADMTGSSFPVVDRVRDYINAGLADVYDLLVNSYEDYFRESTEITMVANQEAYNLPSNFYKLLECYYLSGSGTGARRYAMQRYERKEIDGYHKGPMSGGTMELEFIPSMPKLVDEDDELSWDLPVMWEDYVALHAAVRLLIREESDPSALMAERDAIKTKIVDLAEPRDMNQGHVQDMYNRWNRTASLFREQRYLRYRLAGKQILLQEFENLGA